MGLVPKYDRIKSESIAFWDKYVTIQMDTLFELLELENS